MRTFSALGLLVFAVSWLGCSTALPPMQQAWEETEVECRAPEDDQCVTLLCLGNACGFYRCGDRLSEAESARFAPMRPPEGAVVVFPSWGGAPQRVIPPSRQLTPGRWEKHHIFPQTADLAEWFKDRGVKIHDYAMPIPRELHGRIHGGSGRGGAWNDAWRAFMVQNKLATPEEIYRHAGELISRFNLIDRS
ncbi:TIGR02269 family lipoprotein [Pyxidicoccus parkwayensis]|uniref:TIGR02269 family lipoprotein n=1 Tax=Pyxidicoccus parkwayensis TaxID=2813578 RepID=A0ABX7PAQ9_9BACT|nr:TIGR02269 family lipoprotein [Pyxidicoccus parkwaysis]QSQ27542.1 TIGR02269 family lipoprotein [Pyxidicoccus parkwaysis]